MRAGFTTIRRSVSVTILASALFLTACGGEEPADEAAPGAAPVAPAPATDPAPATSLTPAITPAPDQTPTANEQDFCQNVRNALAARPTVGGTPAEMEQRGRAFIAALQPVVRTAPESTRNFWQAVEQIARDGVKDTQMTMSVDEARRLLVTEAPKAVAEVARTCNISASDLSAMAR